MSKLKLGLLGAIVVGAAAVFVLQHNSNKQLRDEAAQLQAQLQQTEASSLAVDSASTSATETGATQDESEILRLRGRISQMSQELLTLRSNQEAQARMLSMMERPFDSAQFPDSHIPINLPLATNAGTATPAAMLQTWLWAMRNGDPEGLHITCDWPDGTSEAEVQEDVNRRVQSAKELQGQPRDFEDYQLQALWPLGDGFYLATFYEWRDPIPRKFVGRRFFRKTEDGWKFAMYRPKQAAFLGENAIHATEATR